MTLLNALSSRQIGERQRPRLFAAVAALLIAAAVALNLTAPTPQSPPAVQPATAATGLDTSTAEARRAVSVGRAFAAGYLAYLYRQAPAREIPSATRAVRRRLAALRPVGAMARSLARIGKVAARPFGRGWLVRARVADRSDAAYAIEVMVERRHGRLVVVRVVGD